MKYIVFRTKDKTREIPIIFPNHLVHLEVAKALAPIVGTSHVVSAGEFSSKDIQPSCYGRSITIGIKSRNTQDDNLIEDYDYLQGMVS